MVSRNLLRSSAANSKNKEPPAASTTMNDNVDLLLKLRATKQELQRAMDGHILAEAQLSGTYQRKK
jgi:phosphatidylethanolamine-binding protein (PEBP) family uncharacterized protein